MFKRSKGLATLIALLLLTVIIAARLLNLYSDQALARDNKSKPVLTRTAKKAEKLAAPVLYGIPTDTLAVVEGVVQRGENLSEILTDFNINPTQVHTLAQKARKVYNVRNIAAHKNYTLLHSLDSGRTARYFIYEPNPVEYVVYDLRGDTEVKVVKRDVEVVERTLAGVINRSLFEDMVNAGGSPQLVNKFADIYAWRLNLSRLQPGDKFKLIYDEKVVNGTTIGYGELKSAVFEHDGREFYAIGFDQGNGLNYYDEKGQSLKRAFLKEPLEYSRISSRFSKRRFHPVQKRYKAHLGTDFAAPRGTPIRTVGNGKVLEARYTRGNGYYVKIRHNKTYTTQYLHMSRFAKGIRAGATVKQGQTIGYVGSTGLATGPHLCYRFWKNGRQVDALRVKLPTADPVKKRNKAAFTALKEQTVKRMQAIDIKNAQPELLASGKAKKPSGV